ncbi:hypothetical protein DFH07DRAFT_16580 [Mycena maculata]|uniref:Uncharacterized protein n=1 Tax=Mycena maculata TaxID=230809 RepID=A0AAD7N3Y6_9AGAR|nr:hypothetical protein DFH07DRAFT_16580 [Mycena maculata]
MASPRPSRERLQKCALLIRPYISPLILPLIVDIRMMSSFDYNAGRRDIPGLLIALQHAHGPEFIDASKTFFSEAKYASVAAAEDPFVGWDDLAVPDVMLPANVVRKLVTRTMESIPELGNEAATGLFLSGTLVGLFGGTLRDKPEKSFPGTELRRGGEIFCRDEMLMFLREREHQPQKNFLDSLAQVLCELFAVWHLNRRMNAGISADKLTPVRACLCDASETHFLSYNGLRFSKRSV